MSSTPLLLPPALERIVQRFQQVLEPKRRYEYLLCFANRLPPFPEDQKQPENKVPGCASQVYVTATLLDGKIILQGDSDSLITIGLVGLFAEGLNGLSSLEITQLTPDFIQRTGLDISLTASRANGFYNIFQTIQKKVLVCHLAETYLQS
jgi:cysteine desulfuration protein SufE